MPGGPHPTAAELGALLLSLEHQNGLCQIDGMKRACPLEIDAAAALTAVNKETRI